MVAYDVMDTFNPLRYSKSRAPVGKIKLSVPAPSIRIRRCVQHVIQHMTKTTIHTMSLPQKMFGEIRSCGKCAANLNVFGAVGNLPQLVSNRKT